MNNCFFDWCLAITHWVLFTIDFAAYHFIGRGAANQGVTSKRGITAWANTRLGGVIFADTFFETFHQSAFAAFAVFKQLRFTLVAIDVDCGGGAFFVGFGHWLFDY